MSRVAVIYARYSPRPEKALPGAEVHDSIAYQLEQCHKYAGMHGWFVAATYADEALSGASLTKRVELQKAISHLQRLSEPGVLLAYSLSRLARNTSDAIFIANEVRNAEAELACVRDSIDTTSAGGRFFFSVMAAMAQFEREQLVERTIDAMTHYQWTELRAMSSNPPYGFAHGKDDADRTVLVPVQQELEVIREMAALCEEGMNEKQIASTLRSRRRTLRTKNISAAMVKRCLKHASAALNAVLEHSTNE